MADIDEPFQLASYTSSSRWKRKKANIDHVYTTSIAKSRREGYVTVSAQSDGIHLLDISTMHPVASHTLGPSTSFSCPAITTEASPNHFATYAVIESSSEFTAADLAGRVIWKWTQHPGSVSSISESQKKTSKTVVDAPQRIHGLHTNPTLPGRIFTITTTGDILVLDSDTLEQKAKIPNAASSVFQAFVFSNSQSSGVTISTALSSSSGLLQLRIVSINDTDDFTILGEYQFSHKSDQISSITYSQSGFLSVLCKNAEWHSYSIPQTQTPATTSITPKPYAQPLKLNTSIYTFPSGSKPQNPAAAVQALTASHVLLASTSSSTPTSSPDTIHIQIWDLQYSIILSTHSLSIPSAFASALLQLRLSSSPSSPTSSSSGVVTGQAVLMLSPVVVAQDKGGKKDINANANVTSNLLLVPYTIPTRSTIAAALGRGGLTKRWLAPTPVSTSDKESSQSESNAESEKTRVLNTIREALQASKVAVAEKAFEDWVVEAEKKSVEVEGGEKGENVQPVFTYGFVKSLVDALLPPVKANGKAPYLHSSVIMRGLMTRGLVSNGMVDGKKGVLGALRTRGDWLLVELAFSTIQDLPVGDLIECLAFVVRTHQKTDRDAMDVDEAESSQVPTVAKFLGLTINYTTASLLSPPSSTSTAKTTSPFAPTPTAPAHLILALKAHLLDPTSMHSVFETLVSWLRTSYQQRKNQDLGVWPRNKDMEKNEFGVLVYCGRASAKEGKGGKAKGPSVEKIIAFLQPFLDASFLPLLQHVPSHKLLVELQRYLGAENLVIELLLQLQGSLEPFGVCQKRIVKEASERAKTKGTNASAPTTGDWRAKRGGAPGVAGSVGSIGAYHLEELVF